MNAQATTHVVLDQALRFHAAGFNVFPVEGKHPIPVTKANGEPGQYAWGRWKTTRQTEQDVRSMDWQRATGIGGLGGPGGLACIDFDSPIDDTALTAFLSLIGLADKQEWVVWTPGKVRNGKRLTGYHVWVNCPGLNLDGKARLERTAINGWADQIELRGSQTYALLPGSLHPDRGFYQFLLDDTFPDCAPPTVDPELVRAAYDAITEQPQAAQPATAKTTTHVVLNGNGAHGGRLPWVEKAFDEEIAHLRSLRDGRNVALNDAAFKLGGYLSAGVFSRSELEAALFDASVANGYVAKRGEAQTRATIHSGIEAGLKKPRDVKVPGQRTPEEEDAIRGAESSAGMKLPPLPPHISGAHVNDNGAGPGATSAASSAPSGTSSTSSASSAGTSGQSAMISRAGCTDLGNAWRLVAYHGGDLRYVAQWEKWLVWDGRRWAEDVTGEIVRRAKATVREIYKEAHDAADPDRRKALSKWAVQSENYKQINAMIALARTEPEIAIVPVDLDTDPMLLNCANGTLDLRTGQLRPHDRADLITKITPIHYDPGAQCPLWIAFLNRIMAGDEEMIAFLQRAMGYTLTSSIQEQCLFFQYGDGRNGKSTFSDTQYAMMGDYALKLGSSSLMLKKNDGGVPNDIARLHGTRFVLSSELEKDKSFAEALLKDLTGGDIITARFLRKEFFDFKPTHKLWLYGNHRPNITGTDEGIWRRINLIPFEVKIPKPEQDTTLPDKLLQELPGILAWAVRGCLQWQRNGLQVPNKVRGATAKYRASMDVVGIFIDDCTSVDPLHFAKFAELYQAYNDWCMTNNETPLNARKFGTALDERGFNSAKGTGNVAIRWGLGLLTSNNTSNP